MGSNNYYKRFGPHPTGDQQHMKEMRQRSGAVDSNDKLVCFLYVLMRDYLPCGDIESIVLEHIGNQKVEFANGWLANYAKDIAGRLNES